jgi:2-polyprenyl-3-methyl-5-hydroxy-6-metoxy-1,4-benzoquinol methylase
LIDELNGVRRVLDHSVLRDYYDRIYYNQVTAKAVIPLHYRRLARRFEPWRGKRLLDVGCGTGIWLRAAAARGAVPAGVDISQVAVEICRQSLPQAEVHCGPAERLSYSDAQFDFVSCLGSLEHFVEPERALREIVRVARPTAEFLLLVPNAGFLPRRLGLYAGTEQATVREEVRTIREWQELFESAGLRIQERWKDLHVLSTSWITLGPWYSWPIRAAQALALPLWPLSWQYQIYYHCTLGK